MSIFFKFGVESGDPMKVNCDGMDMSLAELKLAIKDLKGIKNVTDFDLQIEHVQNKTIYDNKNEKQLIPRGVTVLVKRVPMPRGEKKVWREERVEKELSTQEVTSTSEEGRLDQVLAVSGLEYGKENWERIRKYRPPRPLSGDPVAPEKRYAHGIPSSMLVTAEDSDTTAAKVDKFGQLKLTAVEREGYGNEKVENLDWLKEDSNGSNSNEAVAKDVPEIPKDLQCPFCNDLLSAAVWMPCCVAAACDECARNMLIDGDLKCSLCNEKDISPTDLIPVPMLRKKVAAYKNQGKEVKLQPLKPLPKLLTGNNILPAEIMLQRQKESEEEKKKIEEKKLVDAVLANINDTDPTPDNLPISDAPNDIPEDDDHEVGANDVDESDLLEPVSSPRSSPMADNDESYTSRPSSRAENVVSRPSSRAENSASRSSSRADNVTSRPSSPVKIDASGLESPLRNPSKPSSPIPAVPLLAESIKSPEREPAEMSSTVTTPPPTSSEPAQVPDSTASPPDTTQTTSSTSTDQETYSIQSTSSNVPGSSHTIQTTYNNSYNTYHYPTGYYQPPVDFSLPPPGYAAPAPYYPSQAPAPYSSYSSSKTYMYDEHHEDRWRKDRRYRDYHRDRYDKYHDGRRRHRSRSYERRDKYYRDRYKDRYERRHSRERDRDRREGRDRRHGSRERYRSRSRSRERYGSKERSRSMSRDKERHGSVERSRSRDLSKEREKDVSADSENVEKKSIDQNDEDNPLDKKEEARLKLKELISKNRHTVEDVKRKRERDDDKERMEMEAEPVSEYTESSKKKKDKKEKKEKKG